jgi:heme exporter protein CcmD
MYCGQGAYACYVFSSYIITLGSLSIFSVWVLWSAYNVRKMLHQLENKDSMNKDNMNDDLSGDSPLD